MAVLEILRMGDPRLLTHAKPVQDVHAPEIRQLISDMHDTMRAANGVGLAAPQVGVSLQLLIFGLDTEICVRYPDAPQIPRTILINPVLEILTQEQDLMWEGCLSVPGMRGIVPRYLRLRYTGIDAEGNPIDRTVEGFHARVVQHEYDHLIGTLYPMRMPDMSRFGFNDVVEMGQVPLADD